MSLLICSLESPFINKPHYKRYGMAPSHGEKVYLELLSLNEMRKKAETLKQNSIVRTRAGVETDSDKVKHKDIIF